MALLGVKDAPPKLVAVASKLLDDVDDAELDADADAAGEMALALDDDDDEAEARAEAEAVDDDAAATSMVCEPLSSRRLAAAPLARKSVISLGRLAGGRSRSSSLYQAWMESASHRSRALSLEGASSYLAVAIRVLALELLATQLGDTLVAIAQRAGRASKVGPQPDLLKVRAEAPDSLDDLVVLLGLEDGAALALVRAAVFHGLDHKPTEGE